MMSEIIRELLSPELAFLRCAVLVGILAGPTLGIVGSLVVTRRISSLAGACAHAALGGVGLALFLQRVVRLAWCTPTLGAVAGALYEVLLIAGLCLCLGDVSPSWALVGDLIICTATGMAGAMVKGLLLDRQKK